MSTSNPQNIYSAIAHHLTNPQVLSTEQKVFQDALKTVEDRRKNEGKLPKIFDNLNHAQTIADVKLLLQTEKASNMIWKDSIDKKWLKIFGKYAEYIWTYKGVLDAATSSNLGGPIDALLSFVINVFKEIGTALEYMENAERTLGSSANRFTRYMDNGVKISTDLQYALSTYYEVVIDFAIDVHSDFTSNFSKSAFKVVHKTLLIKLKSFDLRIHHIIDDVDKSANIDKMQCLTSELTALKGQIHNALVNPPVASSTPLPTALHMIHGLPQLNRNFTGQQQSLRGIWELLNRNPHTGQKRTAIYGMGGIGKTQILLKYAYDHIQAAARPRPYDAVIWINAISERSVFATITSFMKMNGFHEPLSDGDETSYTAFYTRLKQYSKHWLLIFDNVSNHKHILNAIPPGNDGHVLFSTRPPVIAEQLASMSDNLQIIPMDKPTAMKLVSRLAELSENAADRDTAIASDVADFSGGLPLLIEQIVHNAILGRRSLISTLEDVRKRTKLLEQKNSNSLHEDDLSLGGLVMQTLDTLDSGYPRAGALLKILIYLEPSSIPISLFQDCAGNMQRYFDRKCTYDRGAADQISGRQFDRKVSLDVPGSSQKDSSRHRLRSLSPFRRSRSGQDLQDCLPVDDVEPASSLPRICGPGTPLGQLFENQIMVDDAFNILVNSAIIRKVNDKERWLHDRISEVAKAVVAEDMVTNQHMALAAAAMVYITFPTPSGVLSGARRSACRTYLPHAISCHANLTELGILNDCSIGPELSHVIASALHMLGTHLYDKDGVDVPDEQRQEKVTEIVHYYQQAYKGYLAGWRRLKTDYSINDETIFLHIKADRQQEASLSLYYVGRYTEEHERLGHSAPWRAIQTACKLAYWLEKDPTTIDEAIAYIRAVFKFCTLVFGPNDEDTIHMKWKLYQLLSSAQRWQEAYEINMQGIKDLAEWRPGDDKRNRKTTFGAVTRNKEASDFASRLGECCMALSRDASISMAESRTRASEAAMWIEIAMRNVIGTFGPDECYACKLYIRYAEAYERAGKPRAALYWYGRGAFCSLSQMIWEHEDWGSDPEAGVAIDEYLIKEAVTAFEAAMIRLVGEAAGQLGSFEGLDVDLKRYLNAVEGKIAVWRADREIYGVWDSWKDGRDEIQRQYEEREAEIRIEEEKIYGKIPDLWDLSAFDDEDKENSMVPQVEVSDLEVQDEDASSRDTLQVLEHETGVISAPRQV